MQVVGSYYLAIRHRELFCWTQHVSAPYLDQPASGYFVTALPSVRNFHDYEPSLGGIIGLTRCLDQWSLAGAKRFIDFRELASNLGCRLALSQREDDLTHTVERQGPLPVRSVRIRVQLAGRIPDQLSVDAGRRLTKMPLDTQSGGVGVAELPLVAF